MARQKPRILIVEDEQHIGVTLKFNCDAEGYDCTLVQDGPSALQVIDRERDDLDLVILDLMLPGMSGYAVLEKMRDADVQIPVLILSARTLSEDKIRGWNAGADGYLTKPFELPELLSQVRNLLSRRAQLRSAPHVAATDETFEFNGARISFSRHEVSVRGEPRSLTSLEMKLLKFFIEREGVVLTRNELLDNVWGVDSSPVTRTVDNFVARLRQHFEIDPANPRHFLSVRGVGYRFLATPSPHSDDDSSSENG